jgi:threonine/homoserine/homoserine lactone efflux protein
MLTFTVVYSPGPMTMFLMNNGIQYGIKKTLPALYGASTAYFVSILIFAFGISNFLNQHLILLELIKYIGAGYMLYLAYGKYINRYKSQIINKSIEYQSSKSLFFGGIITGLSNPKAILLFSLVFPQFLYNSKNLKLDCAILGISYLLLQFSSGCCYCYFGQRIKNLLSSPKMQVKINIIIAAVFVMVALMFLFINVS